MYRFSIKRNYNSVYSIKKYYGFEIVDSNIYLYQKNYGDDLQDVYDELEKELRDIEWQIFEYFGLVS